VGQQHVASETYLHVDVLGRGIPDQVSFDGGHVMFKSRVNGEIGMERTGVGRRYSNYIPFAK
jgi:hypothetical protein